MESSHPSPDSPFEPRLSIFDQSAAQIPQSHHAATLDHHAKSLQQTNVVSPKENSLHLLLSQDVPFNDGLSGLDPELDPFMSLGISPSFDLPEVGHASGSLQSSWASSNSFFPENQKSSFSASGLQTEPFGPAGSSDFPGLQQRSDVFPPSWPGSGRSERDMVPAETLTRTKFVRNADSHPGLPRRRSRYWTRRSGYPADPVFIPYGTDTLDPMQRWQESPPEDEPASLSAIMDALTSSSSHSYSEGPERTDLACQPVSLASSNDSGTSVSSWQSATSTRSAAYASSGERSVAQSRGKHGRVRKTKRDTKRPVAADKRRIFCCTFCCDRFKNRYDWVRHEKSLHLNLETWLCAPHGGAPVSPLTGRRHCAYCHCLEPSVEHLDQHSYEACLDRSPTFRRKDHLVQHLRLAHSLETMPLIDDWKTTVPAVTSRCGFCNHRLSSWDERIEHLASHFRKGSTMDEWQGDHDFPPLIAAKVTNALPPYLIGSESKTMVPFSATSSNVKDHFAQISTRAEDWAGDEETTRQNEAATLASPLPQPCAQVTPLSTFTEILTRHLGRYARQQMSLGVIPTDEMFQEESRQLLYDSRDSWNQTIADNPEWLSAFKSHHCQQIGNGGSAGDSLPRPP